MSSHIGFARRSPERSLRCRYADGHELPDSARIGQSHMGDRTPRCPASPFDRQACCRCLDGECCRHVRVSSNCPNNVFGLGPRHVCQQLCQQLCQQPWTWRVLGERLISRRGNRRQFDHPLLQAKRLAAGEMKALKRKNLGCGSHAEARPVGLRRLAKETVPQPIFIVETKGLDLDLDLLDRQLGRLRARLREKGTGLAAPFDEPGAGKQRERLVDGLNASAWENDRC
jgi:hypothetical protein